MKEFNLELAKQGHSVCTREGKPARIICWDRKSGDSFPIIALVQKECGTEICLYYTKEGRYWGYPQVYNCDDLMMTPTKKEGWINLYQIKGEVCAGGNIFKTKAEAENIRRPIIATIKIEWEE